ncbi:MAG TPA: glycosyltransferase family 9 protein [Opitutaceae bacterium]
MKLLRPVTVPAHLAEKWRTNIQLLVEDRAIPIFSEIFDGDIAVQNITLPKSDLSKPTMICRSAGIGDIFFIGFAIQKLRNMGIKSDLALYSLVDHTWIFQRFFSLDVAWLHAPCLYDSAVKRYPNIVTLEHSIEHVDIQVQRKTHITSLFASGLNVELSPAELPGLLKVKPGRRKFLPPGPKYVGIHPVSNSWTRSLTDPKLKSVVAAVLGRGYTPVIYGQIPKPCAAGLPAGCVVLTDLKLPFNDQVETLSELKGFVGIDSCFVYFAQAFGTPTVGLYASVSPETRTIDTRHDRSLMSPGECRQCYFHHRYGKVTPAGACGLRPVCQLLQNIPDADIIANLESAIASAGGKQNPANRVAAVQQVEALALG